MTLKILSALCLLLLSTFSHSYTLEFTESQLQEKISAMMPVTKKTMLATIVVDDAILDLVAGSERLALSASIQADALAGLSASGSLKIMGTLKYNAQQGAFYFHEPKLIELNIKDVPPKFHEQIKKLAQAALAKSLSRYPVYKLKDDNMKQQLAKSMLKSMEVKDQTLVVTLGLF
ncbi:MAG: DUF1439 domain-containing protein [Bermanella sp.]